MEGQTQWRDHAIAQLAARQHGVVGYRQLVALGLSKGAIERRVRGGRLHRVHRAVYAVGHWSLSRYGELMAAALAYGPGALISHWSAAELWGFTMLRRHEIHVSAEGARRRRPGLVFHHPGHLPARERARRNGIAVTSPARTLFDVAAVADARQLRQVVEEAERAGWLNARAMKAICETHRGEPGIRALRSAVAALVPGTRRTRSELEARFLDLCRVRRIPLPIVNARVEGFERPPVAGCAADRRARRL